MRLSWRSPRLALAVLSVLSFAARIVLIDEPCHHPCRSAADHVLIFDEVYYVNAAKVIDRIHLPAGSGEAQYGRAPLGDDPNAEHPQGVKLVIAAAIELFGDNPFAWRIGSVLMGSIALLGMYALARACGAAPWPSVLAAALMASDNLLLVAGRIGTLDIYAVAMMVWAGALYLWRRPVLAGAVLAVGAAFKEVAPYLLVALALLELVRCRQAWWNHRLGGELRAAAWRLGRCAAVTVAGFVALLWVMGVIGPPYNAAAHEPVAAGPFHHLAHIISFAHQQSSPHGPQGIASLPWTWLFDVKPIVYLNINPSQPAAGLFHVHPAAHFIGLIDPPMLLLALPALALAAGTLRGGADAARRGSWLRDPAAGGSWQLGDAPAVGLTWVLGTLGPYALLSLVWHRTSYLYYMVIVMPGLYLVIAALAVRARGHPRLVGAWAALIVIALVLTFPFTPLPGLS